MNNKGLSNIIATVLIVLLALAAVAIVWTVMNGLIGDTSGQIELTNLCVLSEAKPTHCKYAATGGNAEVTVQLVRGEQVVAGDGKAGVQKVVAVVTSLNKMTSRGDEVAPKKLSSTTVSVTGVTGATQADFATATVTVQDEAGNTKTCDESTIQVDCTAT
ncbi:hypothetical protein J4402_01825 [Candidatus Pacearchaeota archaeon]|nr:hypothetical protein [Candidatus Pacearchaeota archaeon]